MVRRGQILPQQILRNLDGINNHAIGAHGEKTRTQCCRFRSRIIAQSSLESTLKFAVTVSRCARSAPEIHKVSRPSVRQKSACRSPATKKGRCRLHGGASGSGAPSWQAEWPVPSRGADQGRDCGAAEIQHVAENAPRWPDMNA